MARKNAGHSLWQTSVGKSQFRTLGFWSRAMPFTRKKSYDFRKTPMVLEQDHVK